MAKKKSSLINMLVALFVITAVSGGLLGLVYGMTKDAIAEVDQKKNEAAIQAVLPLEGEITYVADTLHYYYEGVEISLPCNLAYDANGTFQGMTVKTSEGGFGGKIELMVGFLADGTIKGTSVLSHAETPGLGANMTGKFKDQFVDKNPANYKLTVKKDGGDVDAITAATITSRAFSKAVNKAYQAFDANKAQFMNSSPAEEIAPEAEEEVTETTEGGTENE